ncbi:MAG: metallophosphoesterase family protein [Chloroflexi bacterium]|nr:metallophosphoesterase family protein [Chloroflexota bacterium]
MRVAVLSDIHSNLVALDAVIAAFDSIDAVWHLGDVVGYGPEPDGVVERLAGLEAVGVRGNHDAAACGGREIEYFNPDARAAMEWTRDAMSSTTRAWLEAQPERRTEGDFTLVHGSPRDPIWEYITTVPIARANLTSLDTPYGLHGHTHVPVAFRDDDGRVEVISPARGSELPMDGRTVLLNPGSVGQPRDGDPMASWLVIDTEAARCSWHRVGYDIPAVQAAMTAAGLPSRLVGRLGHGI